jgi:hypothetical protein
VREVLQGNIGGIVIIIVVVVVAGREVVVRVVRVIEVH